MYFYEVVKIKEGMDVRAVIFAEIYWQSIWL